MNTKQTSENFSQRTEQESIIDHMPFITAIKKAIARRREERQLTRANAVFEELGRITLSH